MSDLSPELISQISSRLLQEAQAAAGGSFPGLGSLLPTAATATQAVEPEAPAAATVAPAHSSFPLAAGLPGFSSVPNLSLARQLPAQLHLDPATIPGLASPTAVDLPNQDVNPEGLRSFVERVQSTHWQNRNGLCSEPAVKFPVHAAPAGVSPSSMGGTEASRPLDIPTIRQDFPILNQLVHGKPLIWFDNAATTQKPLSVIETLSNYYARDNSNIHRAAHTLAARATDAYENAREKVRQFVGAGSADEIIFVRGTTEGINLIAQMYGRKFLQPGDEIVLSTLEHHANIVPWQQVAREKGAILRVIPVTDRGEIMLEEYQSLLGARTKLVSLSHASNSLGTLLPIRDMIQMAKRYNARVLIDGAQTVAHEPVDVQQLDCDFFVFSGHKIYGPTGIGAVFAKSELQEILPPWQGGGNMIRNVTFEETTFAGPPAKFEAGTPNIADAVGLGAALDYVSRLGLPNISKYEHELLEYATGGLSQIPGLRLVGLAREKVGVISFVLPGKKTEEIGRLLDLEGIAVRAGHHCAQPSLRRFGLEATVRASFAFYNTKHEIDRLIAAVRRIQSP
jgi:cysteine desulfurase/selenocysteine lyase